MGNRAFNEQTKDYDTKPTFFDFLKSKKGEQEGKKDAKAPEAAAAKNETGNQADFQQKNTADQSKQAKPFRIAMLGNSGTGKTCYIAALNCCFIQFTTTNVRMDVDRHRDIDDKGYHAINAITLCDGNRKIKGKTFPPGTSQNTIFPFTMSNDRKECCQFDFIDYKGKWMDEADKRVKEAELAKDLKELREFLSDSEVFMVFVDGVKLSRQDTPEGYRDAAKAWEIDRIITEMNRNSSEKKDFLIVITKTDDPRISDDDRKDCYDRLLKKAEEAFDSFKANFKSLAIVPISAVGEGNTIISTQTDSNGITREICEMVEGNEIKPERIECSMVYACECILDHRIKMLKDEINDIDRLLAQKTGISRAKREESKKKQNELASLMSDYWHLRLIINHVVDQFSSDMKYLRKIEV